MNNPSQIKAGFESPLRYPGGKRFLCPYIERILSINNLCPQLLVEPFAGGASVALHLLGKGLVKEIALYDADPLVAGLWWSVFYDGEWIQARTRDAEITLAAWQELRNTPLNGHRTNGWKCLFLNRTSFSGILSPRAGPIGGKAQASDYKIDCRFYRQTTIGRLMELSSRKDSVRSVGVADWRATVRKYTRAKNHSSAGLLFYFDPPFYHKADRLYGHYFKPEQHEALVARVAKIKAPWILSYDDCPEVVKLFRKYGMRYRKVPVQYTSSARKIRDQQRELVASNLLLPRNP